MLAFPRPSPHAAPCLSVLAWLLFWSLAAPAQAASPTPWSGKVTKVESGSTLEVRHGEKSERVNLAGVAAPHVGQPWGEAAKRFAMEGTQGQAVTVEPQGTDSKKGTLATVILPDGRDLGAELIKEGLAWHHRRTAKNPMLADLEKDAKAERRGLWADPKPAPPWEWTGPAAAGDAAEEEPPPRKKKRR